MVDKITLGPQELKKAIEDIKKAHEELRGLLTKAETAVNDSTNYWKAQEQRDYVATLDDRTKTIKLGMKLTFEAMIEAINEALRQRQKSKAGVKTIVDTLKGP